MHFFLLVSLVKKQNMNDENIKRAKLSGPEMSDEVLQALESSLSVGDRKFLTCAGKRCNALRPTKQEMCASPDPVLARYSEKSSRSATSPCPQGHYWFENCCYKLKDDFWEEIAYRDLNREDITQVLRRIIHYNLMVDYTSNTLISLSIYLISRRNHNLSGEEKSTLYKMLYNHSPEEYDAAIRQDLRENGRLRLPCVNVRDVSDFDYSNEGTYIDELINHSPGYGESLTQDHYLNTFRRLRDEFEVDPAKRVDDVLSIERAYVNRKDARDDVTRREATDILKAFVRLEDDL